MYARADGIYVQDIDRTTASPLGAPQLVAGFPSQYINHHPSWSVDGEIWYAVTVDEVQQDIYTVIPPNAPAPFHETPDAESSPVVSPSGDLVAWIVQSPIDNWDTYDIVVVDLTNAGLETIDVSMNFARRMTWNAAGTGLFFEGEQGTSGPAWIFCVDVDEVDPVPIGLVEGRSPSLSADDSELMYLTGGGVALERAVSKVALDYQNPLDSCPLGVVDGTQEVVIPPERSHALDDPELWRPLP